jgi:hypothetical protein
LLQSDKQIRLSGPKAKPTSLLTLSLDLELSATSALWRHHVYPTEKQARSRIGYAHRMAAYGLGGPFNGRHGPAYRLFTSGPNSSLAAVDEFGRTRNLGHRCTGRVVLVVRSSRRRYYPVDVSGAYAFIGFATGMLSETPTSAGVLIRVNGANSIIDPISSPNRPGSRNLHRKPAFSVMFHFVSNEITALLQVVLIDMVLAGDNAIVIGLAAAGLTTAATHESCPGGYHRRDGSADNIRRSHHPVIAGTYQCPSTMCWPLQVPHASISLF